ncbi:MAG: hypothetical protein WCF57_08945 [Pyrinomonadaceae bacterium]
MNSSFAMASLDSVDFAVAPDDCGRLAEVILTGGTVSVTTEEFVDGLPGGGGISADRALHGGFIMGGL